jgi:hypothetical protein
VEFRGLIERGGDLRLPLAAFHHSPRIFAQTPESAPMPVEKSPSPRS